MKITAAYLEARSEPDVENDQFFVDEWAALPPIDRMRIGEMLHRLTFVGPTAHAYQIKAAGKKTRRRLHVITWQIATLGAAGWPWFVKSPDFVGPRKPRRLYRLPYEDDEDYRRRLADMA